MEAEGGNSFIVALLIALVLFATCGRARAGFVAGGAACVETLRSR